MNAKMMFGVVITAVALSAGMGTAGADDSNGPKVGRAKPSAPLVGAWQVRVTPCSCQTGVELPEVAFDSLLTFEEGGTMHEMTTNASFQARQRSPGFGFWERTDRDYYRAVFMACLRRCRRPVAPISRACGCSSSSRGGRSCRPPLTRTGSRIP